MADTIKGNVVFLIGDDDDEEEESQKSPLHQKSESSKFLKSKMTVIPTSKDNVKCVNFENNPGTNLHDVRRQSVSSIPSNLNPTRKGAYNRNRHYSDEVQRRFVLNPSSKISLEVRRNHPGSCHNQNKNLIMKAISN